MAIDFINEDMEKQCDDLQLSSYQKIYRIHKESGVRKWVTWIFLILLLVLFLPWTQNIRARGDVTTLLQEQRPAQMPTVIAGRVVKWHVREGDYVKQGDTLVQITEVKDDYLDPSLIARTREQIDAKRSANENYSGKANAASQQIQALYYARDLKLQELDNKIRQQQMKISSDSAELAAALNDLKIKTEQFKRQRVLFDSGVASLVQLEQRNQAFQESQAKRTSAEIKYNNAQQELLRLRIERSGELQQYAEKVSKAEGDRFQSLSQIQTTQGEIAKLENQFTNYTIRNGLYTLTAPMDGQVVKAKKAGIGEIMKEGDVLVEIVPVNVQYAVEMFVRPVDLPLVSRGQEVRFLFDGFPAIVFSGWPNASYGTFTGEVAAVESSVSENGMFRVLVKEKVGEKPWPKELMMGTGALGIALLKDVPVWYELWRNINGFPPDYYKSDIKKSPDKPAAKK
jgi:multidrug efflux pump subunit AcrA (membrane-fusion protein)